MTNIWLAKNCVWLIEHLVENEWIIEDIYTKREDAREEYKYLKDCFPKKRFRISKFVRETPIQVEQMKLSDFIKSVEKAQKATEKSKLRFP